MRSTNCGLNTPTTPSCESIEDQTLGYFKMFRYLFLNNKISNFNRNLTDDLVLTTFDSQTTWKMIEVELGYAYDVYYTKAFLFFTAWGFIFRFFSFTSILFVFVLFLLNEKHNHPRIDLIITYLLLVGAILMEIYAVCLLCASDWPWSATDVVTHFFHTLFAPIRNCFAKLTSKQRWSNSMAQLNLLSLCVNDNSDRAGHKTPKLFANLREWLFNQMLPKLIGELEVTHKQVSADLKDLVYNMFLEKLSSSGNGFSEEYFKYIADRNGTINVEYYQSIIIWHIATDLCFDTDSGVNEPRNDLLRKVSKDVSDYVMYILVMCPFLLSTGDAKFSFKITGAMVTEFFQKKKFARLPKADACAMLISEYDAFFGPKYEALDVRINNDSLEDCLLHFAVLIEKKLSKMERKWEILSIA